MTKTISDQELLELAARAAGECFSHKLDNGVQGKRTGPFVVRRQRWTQWNPLTDDGDALRLAEQCSLTVCIDGTGTVSACDQRRKKDVFVTQSIRECGGSRIVAARRAIVRAAAAIGEGM